MIVKIYLLDYGNSLTPWSVGKYAKRSATIHLNSNDVMPNNAHQFADATRFKNRSDGSDEF